MISEIVKSNLVPSGDFIFGFAELKGLIDKKCREKCGELAKERLNVDERICGLCVSVCPKGL